jgi:hypothetical protein
MTNANFLAQIGHTLGGVLFVLVPTIFLGFHQIWIGGAILLVWALLKEFAYDLKYELPKQSFGDSLLDFVFYMLGGALGIGVASLAHVLGRLP